MDIRKEVISKTEKFRCGPTLILLVIALMTSMLLIAVPVSATGGTAPSSPIKVQSGKVFLLRGSITLDKASAAEFSYGPVYWYSYGNENENFTLENTPSVYWFDCTTDNSLDGQPVENVTISDYAIPDGWQIEIKDNGGGNLVIWPNGTLYVDIWLRAQGYGGVPHALENQDISFAMDQITIWEPGTVVVPAGPITVQVLGEGVIVTVDPKYRSGLPGVTLNYTVTVKNTGGVEDNYDLTVNDDSGWGPMLDDNRFENVPPDEDRTTTLSVTIPDNAAPCAEDNITVTAAGTSAIDSDSCTAHAAFPLGVEVSISPSYLSGLPGATLDYTVTVSNMGALDDNYDLTVSDNLSWGPTVSPPSLTVPAGENMTSTLSVTIPENATPYTEDNITVTATSTENSEVSDSTSCIARALYSGIFVRGKETAYSYNSNPPPPLKTYVQGDNPPMMMAEDIGTGRVVASGIVTECRLNPTSDNFAALMDAIFQWLSSGKNVLWFDGYGVYCTSSACIDLIGKLDNKGYTIIGDATTPITSSMLAPYDILVLPEMQLGSAAVGGDPDLLPDSDVQAIKGFVEGGKGLLIMSGSDFFGPGPKGNFYRVMNKVLINLGFGYEDKLFGFQSDSVYDDVNNGDERSNKNIDVPIPGGNRQYTPIVDVDTTHPIGAAYQIATGRTTVRAYGGCSLTAIGPGMAMYIIPSYQVGMPGETITYRVIAFNTGNPIPGAENVDLTIDLKVDDDSGWSPTLDNYLIRLGQDENQTVILSVTVPFGAHLGAEDEITVTATAREYPDVRESKICMAHAAKRLEVTKDSYVNSGLSENLNYGDSTRLNIGRYQTDNQWAYLMFENLADIPPGSEISEARLYLFAYSAYGAPQEMLAYGVGDDTWYELAITWNDKPALGAVLDTKVVGYGSDLEPKPYYWDVTSFVQQEFAGDKIASFCVRPADNCLPSTNRQFESSEWWDNRLHPFLMVILAPPSGWDALITATFPDGRGKAIFGVRPDATSGFDIKYDIPEPPPPPGLPYVRAYFYYPEQTPDELHRSCLAPENLMKWPLRIEYADNTENITLTWRIENIPSEYSVFLYQGENLVADMRAKDNYTFEASAGSYDFRIVVGTFVPFTLELTQGWNTISLPVIPENPDPDLIFGGAYYVIYRWDAENRKYVLYADSGSFVEPDPNVEAGVGYWIFSLENRDVTILGVPLMQLTLNLRMGWNMVGSLYSPLSIADPTDDPDNSVLPWAFTWDANNRRYTMGQLLEPGKGYWIYALRDCSLVLSFLKLAIVYDIGGRGDLGFNDMAFMGGKRAEQDFGVKMVEFISNVEADYVPNLRAAAQDPDVKLIVGVGYLLSSALASVAGEFPDKNFVGIDTYTSAISPHPNLMDVVYEEHKGSAAVGALAGLLAAYYNKPHIGAVLGIEIPVLWKFEIGYKWGCDWAMSWIENNKPEMEQGIYNTPRKERVLWTYTGTFDDIAQGYLAAKPMYEEGAVAVYNIAGRLGLGINQAVKEIAEAENLENGPPFWIGVDADQDWINPGFVIASMMKRVDYGVYYSTELVLENKFRDAVQEYDGAIRLGIGTEVLGIPMEGISVSTLDDLDAFLEMGIDAGIIGPENRDAIYAKVKAMRDAQPSWVWEAVGELENRIRIGTENVPEADTLEEVEYWRGILG